MAQVNEIETTKIFREIEARASKGPLPDDYFEAAVAALVRAGYPEGEARLVVGVTAGGPGDVRT